MSYRKIGAVIQLVDERNRDLAISHLVGLTINKKFIPSVANTIGTDMSNYKIIRKNQFACSTMQVRRDKKMPVALLKEFNEAIISQAYPVFEVKDENEVLPDYLMLWFSRSEFDREACFHAVGGVRGSLEWEDFCSMELPIPSIEKQREIVDQYQAVENKIKVNEQICEKLEVTAQTLYKHWFVDFEFPNEEGKPYKSSGGAMVFNEELEKEIPERWEMKSLGEVVNYKKGYAFKSDDYESHGISIIRVSDLGNKYVNHSNFYKISKNTLYQDYSVQNDDILITTVGSWPSNPLSVVGKVIRVSSFANDFYLNQNMVRFRIDSDLNEIIYQYLIDKKFSEFLLSGAQGSANQASITLEHIFNYKIIITSENSFNKALNQYYQFIDNYINQNQKLTQLQSLLLSRLARLEEEIN